MSIAPFTPPKWDNDSILWDQAKEYCGQSVEVVLRDGTHVIGRMLKHNQRTLTLYINKMSTNSTTLVVARERLEIKRHHVAEVCPAQIPMNDIPRIAILKDELRRKLLNKPPRKAA